MSTEFQPKRIKLEILKSDGTQNNKKFVKLMPFGTHNSKGKEIKTEAKVCQILNPSRLSDLHDLDDSSRGTSSSGGLITPTLTLRNVSIHQTHQQQQQLTQNKQTSAAFTTFIKGEPKHDELQSLFDKEMPRSLVKHEPAKTPDVIALSDDTDSEATEKDLDPQRNFDFIEEASVMDDEIMDDFQDLFQHNMNDEQHEKIFHELLNATSAVTSPPPPPKDCDKNEPINGQSTNFLTNAQHQQQPTSNNENSVVTNNSNSNDNHPHNHQDFLINPTSFVPIASKVPDSTHKTASVASDERNESQQPVTTAATSPSIHTTHTEASQSTNADILNYLKRIERRLGNIEKRLTKIEEAQNSQQTHDSESSDADDLIDDDMLLSLKFPIKKKHSLDIFENILKVPKMKRSLELKFKQYLGMNESDTIDMILAEMIDPHVQENFKWRQSDLTRSFENYVYINKLIFDCVKHHFQPFSNVEYIRLMSLILNRPSRISAIQRNFGRTNFQNVKNSKC
ncbi:ankyrin-3-like [Culicoides brevitarsis]|uniref:ankyrin-3-like n=1 Tax=Culicoides brevitarsis TaxID=469753 RepID=UPI00307BFAC7